MLRAWCTTSPARTRLPGSPTVPTGPVVASGRRRARHAGGNQQTMKGGPRNSAVPLTNRRAGAVAPSSDIPGVPLPGPIAAGRLGGAIYDVVYRLSVAPAHVIVASLTGAAGTDFDLSLFDASATTVLSDTGLLKKSTGPTSTESLSWPSSFGGA